MGPELTSCSRPEQMDTKQVGKMMKRIQILEEGRDRELENRGRKKRITSMEF